MTRELGSDLPISERAPELQEVIEKGWNGENATSQVYMDVTLKTPVIAYSVPVYDESGILKGCLLGVRALDVFQDILNETTLSQISLDVAWPWAGTARFPTNMAAVPTAFTWNR